MECYGMVFQKSLIDIGIASIGKVILQGVSPLSVIYYETQFYRKINFRLKVPEDNLNYILCLKNAEFSDRAVSTYRILKFCKIENNAMNGCTCYEMASPGNFYLSNGKL